MSNHSTPAEWLTHLANWIDSYWQDGMRPDEWTLKEWANTCRWYVGHPHSSNAASSDRVLLEQARTALAYCVAHFGADFPGLMFKLNQALGGSDGEMAGEKSEENAVKSTSCDSSPGMETPTTD